MPKHLLKSLLIWSVRSLFIIQRFENNNPTLRWDYCKSLHYGIILIVICYREGKYYFNTYLFFLGFGEVDLSPSICSNRSGSTGFQSGSRIKSMPSRLANLEAGTKSSSPEISTI